MKSTTRLGQGVLAVVAACSSGSASPAHSVTQDASTTVTLLPGEICDPSQAPTVIVHFDPPGVVLAPGQSRPVRLVVDPDLCVPVTASFAMGDATVASAPASAPLDLRNPTFDFQVKGVAPGKTQLAVSVQRPTDPSPTTGTLSIEVRKDASAPACASGDSAQGNLSGSSTTLAGQNSLADAQLSVPPGAFTRTDEFAIAPFSATIGCKGDLSTQAAGGVQALGPAVTFTPGDATWLTHSLRRELDFAIPVNPAAMPAGARMRHVQVLYQGPRAKTPRTIPIANPRFAEQSDGNWVMQFESPWFGTYQAVVSPSAGTVTHTRHLTHRAVLGISMGGGGAAIFGTRHHDQFDAIAPLGGNSDLTWLVWYTEQFRFGGFCPASNPGCTKYAPNEYPLWESFAHTEDFDHWFFQPGGGTGGSFARGDWTNIFGDIAIMGGNPNGQNGDPALPFMVVGPKSTDPFVAGVDVHPQCSQTTADGGPGEGDDAGLPPFCPQLPVSCALTIDPIGPDSRDSQSLQAQEQICSNCQSIEQAECTASRCDPKNTWVAKSGFFDGTYNPDGSLPVISFCDGGQNGTSPYVDTWANLPPGQGVPSNLTLAVDLNGNGVRDMGEPVIRQGEEPYDDTGVDGVADANEPGYDAVNNPDPNGDDYDFQLNPNGTENDHTWEPGEPYQDVGLDGVPNTPQQSNGGYDVGEGDGTFTLSKGAQHLFSVDPHSMLHGRASVPGGTLDEPALQRIDYWVDGGVRDMANFESVGNHLLGTVASRTHADGTQIKSTAFYNNFENLPGSDPTQPDQYLAVNVLWQDVARAAHLRYGYVDATPLMIQQGDGQHVGTGSQIVYRLVTGFYFASNAWPDADHTLADSLNTQDPTDPTYNGETSSPNELCPSVPATTGAGGDAGNGTMLAPGCCELAGHCEKYFTGPKTGRTGPIAVSLPPGYALAGTAARNERYPVLYVLHGYGQDPRDLEATAAITSNYMNDATKSGAERLAKMIVVYVDGRCRIDPVTNLPECYRGTFYMNSDRVVNGRTVGQLDDWFEEVMQYIDQNYRTMGPSDVDEVE